MKLLHYESEDTVGVVSIGKGRRMQSDFKLDVVNPFSKTWIGFVVFTAWMNVDSSGRSVSSGYPGDRFEFELSWNAAPRVDSKHFFLLIANLGCRGD